MGFVRTSNQDDEFRGGTVAPGAPPYPGDPDTVDWNDPEAVFVHYDVSVWGYDQRAELMETLAERNVPHVWRSDDGVDELVVPEMAEPFVDALFAELEAELGPFPIPLDPDGEAAEFTLDDWAEPELDTLRTALLDAEIPHRWNGATVTVAADAADTVDDLVDAIEAGEVASADGEGAPDGALHNLYAYADQLARDPDDAAARAALDALVPQLAVDSPPYGLAVRAWAVIVNRATELAALLATDGTGDGTSITDAAGELRAVCRPYV
ncbi:MAG TPA: hypothetical protein VNQ73_07605 [Ilumatobacter sp.]|nr:hypothetical protein [Ilumatobacter sp.]